MKKISTLCLLFSLALWVVLVVSSCQTVKPYQRKYLNDAEMSSGTKGIEKFEENAQNYREGSTGGSITKGGGGCGCN